MIILVLAFLASYCVLMENMQWRKYKNKGYNHQDYMLVTQMKDPMFVAYAGISPESADEAVKEVRKKYGY